MKEKISINELADQLGVSLMTAYHLVWEHKIEASKDANGRWEITADSVKKYVAGKSK